MLAYRDGDEDAFVALFNRYNVRIFNYFHRHLADRTTSEDLLQNTFLKVHRQRKSYQPSAAFSTWIFTIATNLLRDHLDKTRRRDNLNELTAAKDSAGIGGGSTESVPEQSRKSVEDDYAEKEMAHHLSQAIQSLPFDQKEVILLAKYGEFRYEEIAKILNITTGAVKVRVHRAMKNLEKIVKDRLGTPVP